ncbi:FMN-binding glutamate synthase family protein [Colwellia sp. 4_MG-2023]|uniref:FMN-binding glutamate synthase family protein n=1 Tax=unclassified Colwellia TaxID=196834 RepID=UPI001C09A552|nr:MULTISPECIES: FMN-binding glutamate synthase family protein [unclassified Colwellia]MBU2923439.1 FMN-binding glutamate synthase family protein [Colwellia sp. C2M11]MDO6489093.1 FMN-binding glutamate synthase family protein [Colwellia sp. 6_MG-2023]MDO6508119.1 FMN-binding glutamate synthase family protein [Colwellia sp. 5_MG-2023]MDO6556857.1 FMN-binding glutamate synthase family protein [Colwellia sp. 4_MG-2023]MDO6653799.1 FMN-binding glutamate synthase family protein [Colwellia sp. 3_MG-
MTMRQMFIAFMFTSIILLIGLSMISTNWLWALVILGPINLIGLYDILQTKQSIRRLYPVFGRFRYLLESVRPEIQQYFVESDTSGTPISREFRSLVYQRAKGDRDTRPFGTIFDVNRAGYEWVNHSMQPKHLTNFDPRVKFGGPDCSKPYMSSVLNISAMSYGALSKNAIMSLNRGAKIGGFSHNTGEGSMSPYHLEHGGDIVWQIGTGYFGCRNEAGNFNPETFRRNATKDVVKMIEIKLSQGAKPGHGGILPAAKLTEEIAAIRHVPMGFDVVSPPAHSAFSTPTELLLFVKTLRELSDGKPIGFKLCIGRRDEFLAICKAMIATGITPDFITVDGGEGGTGAAPTEMTNSVGTPIKDALIFVNNALIGFGLRDKMRIIASGKMFSAFHILRAMALGADTVNSARGMMLSLGCIQARTCNTDNCPTGIATQNPSRNKAIIVTNKAQRVANFQRETVKNLVELVGAAGLNGVDELEPKHLNRRVEGINIKSYEQLYPTIKANSLLEDVSMPESWRYDMAQANAASW